MKLRFLKRSLLTSLLVAAASFSYVTAAPTPVAQQAYYDTYTFKVNGIVQYISDITKKPFIANSRVYVPISTLSDLGICKVEWIPANAGIPAELRILPAEISSGKTDYYDQKINQMATEIAQKDSKIKDLEEEKKKLKEENEKLKKESEKKKEEKKDSKSSSDDQDVKKQVSDLEHDINRDRQLNYVSISKKNFDIQYELYYGRRYFEVSLYIKNLDSKENYLDELKSRSEIRNFEYLLEDVVKEIQRKDAFKKLDIEFIIYDHANANKKIGDYTYREDRLRGGLY